MKVTGIRHEKHRCDGAGVVRVIIDYETGNVSREATIYYDTLEFAGAFGTHKDYEKHADSIQALMDIADSYMNLVSYGWEE